MNEIPAVILNIMHDGMRMVTLSSLLLSYINNFKVIIKWTSSSLDLEHSYVKQKYPLSCYGALAIKVYHKFDNFLVPQIHYVVFKTLAI